MAKENNRRVFPGETGRRPDLAKAKRDEAADRKKVYDDLSIEQKIAKLDDKKYVAKKQRAKLAALLEKKNMPVKIDESPVRLPKHDATDAHEEDEKDKKRLKAKERRRKEQKRD